MKNFVVLKPKNKPCATSANNRSRGSQALVPLLKAWTTRLSAKVVSASAAM
jgi:hypothetical protein